MTQFNELGLNASILKALTDKGYTQPTPIQAQAIPGVMSGRDLLGIAQTGTGKTAAFALPILHRLAENRRPAPKRGCRALILSPTRELATQIAESFRTYGVQLGMTVATIFGGVAHGPQRSALARGVDVIVATPGRLLDHIEAGGAELRNVEIFVLDEADQMLDMGFIVPIRQIVRYLPKERQNLFFSATMPNDIGKLADELLKEPLRVSVAPPSTTVERVNQQVVFVEAARKRALLVELFAREDFTRVLVFTRTKRGADKVARVLEAANVSASAIHGNKSQNQRERALSEFKAGSVRALVATDIAARGIDISSVSHVVQYELPEVPEAYVHRIGRTARAGNDGSAVAFCAQDERDLLRDIEKTTRQKIPSVDRRNDPALAAAVPEAPAPKAEPRGRPGERRPQQQQRRPERRPQEQRSQEPHRQENRRAENHRSENPRHENGRSENRRDNRRPDHRSEGRNENRNDQRAEQSVQQQPKSGEGKPHRRRGGRGSGKGGSPGWSGVASKNGSPKPHRKGESPRRDVMKVSAAPSGPVVSATELMRRISASNPWSE